MNSFNLSGRLVKDPEVRDVGSTKVCVFTIANNRKIRSSRGGDGAEKIEITHFQDCELWAGPASYFGDAAKKGTYVVVSGPLETDTFTGKDGQTHRRTKIKVMDFDIPVRVPKPETATAHTGTSNVSDAEDPFQ